MLISYFTENERKIIRLIEANADIEIETVARKRLVKILLSLSQDKLNFQQLAAQLEKIVIERNAEIDAFNNLSVIGKIKHHFKQRKQLKDESGTGQKV